ncbi:uncharacterized protein F4812DRAFT_441784 [Daldinia caldariorum]|uniref:uncharacterized protein n=1 Tax=Daldinia caldariorum TaxID=326644 RepID=UPI0020081F1A|nr:uncharacterized protein F4812DRAFT_441784 [Daldinia caldariorum]KAI1464733.1 hypothetical protein F4812DRAFT_441784 [Daldinia caldariorum]
MFVHQWEISLRSQTNFLWLAYLDENFYIFVVACLKVSILLDWVRIFVPVRTRNTFFWTCHVLLWLNLLFISLVSSLLTSYARPHRRDGIRP